MQEKVRLTVGTVLINMLRMHHLEVQDIECPKMVVWAYVQDVANWVILTFQAEVAAQAILTQIQEAVAELAVAD